jgi:hypothetical protein
MILFKRLGESFRHIEGREWLLLFLETLGVLVGILLAFELQEWAQRRNDAAKHRQLMERLFEESETDVAVLRSIRTIYQAQGRSERNFAIELSAGKCPEKSSWSAVSTINMYPPLTAPSGVYDELMGAGGLSSIQDPSVRAAIERFRGVLDFAARQSEQFHVSRSARTGGVEIDDPRVHVRFDPSADDEVFTYDRKGLCEDSRFRNRMIDAVRDHLVIMSRQADVTDLAIGMCATLGRLVGQTCVPPDGPFNAADQVVARKALSKAKT